MLWGSFFFFERKNKYQLYKTFILEDFIRYAYNSFIHALFCVVSVKLMCFFTTSTTFFSFLCNFCAFKF